MLIATFMDREGPDGSGAVDEFDEFAAELDDTRTPEFKV